MNQCICNFPSIISSRRLKYFLMDDEFFMYEALVQAKIAFEKKEVPIGAVLVFENKIITRAHNLTESKNDPTAHAEILCVRDASKIFDNWRLTGATLYTTLEPCVMCSGALISSRISRVVWGAKDIRQGGNGSWVDLFAKKHPIHQLEIEGGVLAEESAALLKDFFKLRREENAV